jgi:hypothetical protein
MSWESLSGIATRVHLRLFGVDAKINFNDGKSLKTKAILSPHMTILKDYNADFESFALIASLAKEDITDPQSVSSIFTQEKEYQIIKYKLEPDGFYAFFLSE